MIEKWYEVTAKVGNHNLTIKSVFSLEEAENIKADLELKGNIKIFIREWKLKNEKAILIGEV